jgi:RHS repeat-associated protein
MGNDGDMDNLQFDYTGNQIKWIFDDAGNWNIYNLKEYTERNNSLVNPGVEFFYDDNGNLVTDYDRDIVTIRYNLLNLPDTIQFRNGNQIVHRYDASGRRLSTRYVTIYFQLAQPLNQGEVVSGIDVCYEDNVSIVGNDYVENIEYYTARYFDYDLSEVPVESYLANKIYFDQGYIQGFRLVNSTPRYYYFRHDQLGNIREVWVAAYIRYGQTKPAATVQRLQYYPSGLPWKENDTYSPIGQNRKYNGKEFVEMHGLDEYDSRARWYYPAIMRTTTMDPLAEKYYSISPYAWCGNNPVRFVDPDGRAIETAWDLYSLYTGAKSLVNNVKQGNFGSAILDGIGVVADAAAVVVPGVPGGVGAGIKAVRVGDKVADAAKTGKAAENVVDGANDAKKAANKANNVNNPYGSKGKPDHQAKVDELVEKAKTENPGMDIVRERKIQRHDSNRRPDVQVVDPKTGTTTRVYEAERRPESTRNKKRESEYNRLNIPNETHRVGN